jgi:hypothetical protein
MNQGILRSFTLEKRSAVLGYKSIHSKSQMKSWNVVVGVVEVESRVKVQGVIQKSSLLELQASHCVAFDMLGARRAKRRAAPHVAQYV